MLRIVIVSRVIALFHFLSRSREDFKNMGLAKSTPRYVAEKDYYIHMISSNITADWSNIE